MATRPEGGWIRYVDDYFRTEPCNSNPNPRNPSPPQADPPHYRQHYRPCRESPSHQQTSISTRILPSGARQLRLPLLPLPHQTPAGPSPACSIPFSATKTLRFLIEHHHYNANNTPHPSSHSPSQVFMPSHPPPLVPKLRAAASPRTKCLFDMLNVDYDPNTAYTHVRRL